MDGWMDELKVIEKSCSLGWAVMSFSMCLQATMETLLALGLHKQAEQLYRDFRVPEKR